ncbi:MAG: hypothetical protein ACREAW_03270 [Nitrososphaera sp.]
MELSELTSSSALSDLVSSTASLLDVSVEVPVELSLPLSVEEDGVSVELESTEVLLLLSELESVLSEAESVLLVPESLELAESLLLFSDSAADSSAS